MWYEEIVTFETFEVIDKIIYAQFVGKNILFKFINNENRIEVINKNINYRFKHCTSLNDKLYLADNLGEVLVAYDINKNSYETYDLDAHTKDDNNISDILNYDEYIFVVSQYKGILYIFNTESKILEQEDALERRIKKIYKDYTECTIRCWKIEEYLYFIVNNKNDYYICRYDFAEKKLEEISKKAAYYGVIDAYFFEQKLYILQSEFDVSIWNIKSNTIETIDMSSLREMMGKNELKEEYFFSIAVTKKNIWLFPTGDNEDIYVYDITKKRNQRYDKYPIDFHYQNKNRWSRYADIKERKGFIYVAARMSNYYMIIDVQTGKEVWKPTGIYDFYEYYYEYYSKLVFNEENSYRKQQAVYEENSIMMDVLLKYQQKLIYNKKNDSKIGNTIWEALK